MLWQAFLCVSLMLLGAGLGVALTRQAKPQTRSWGLALGAGAGFLAFAAVVFITG